LSKRETILAVDTNSLNDVLRNIVKKAHPYALINKEQMYDLMLAISPHLWFGPREVLEYKPEFKQIIPYVVVANNNNRILIYKRSSAKGDRRLNSLYSIGLGGHIKISDLEISSFTGNKQFINLNALLFSAMKRELNEELPIDEYFVDNKTTSVLGFINLEGKPSKDVHVNDVHFGIVYYHKRNIVAPNRTNEDGMHDFQFINISDALTTFNTGNNILEPWSIATIELLKEKASCLNREQA
jgi:predicted NUDIX family phosphoesterase